MATNQNEEKRFVKLSAMRQQLKAILIFPIISLWKHKLPWQPKCKSNDNKINAFVEANAMNMSAKFQLYRLYN